jgi:hypothetical protein
VTGRYAPDDEVGRRWEAAKAELDEALAAFAPTGDVLELAAGTGNLTRLLGAQPGVTSVTAVDARRAPTAGWPRHPGAGRGSTAASPSAPSPTAAPSTSSSGRASPQSWRPSCLTRIVHSWHNV